MKLKYIILGILTLFIIDAGYMGQVYAVNSSTLDSGGCFLPNGKALIGRKRLCEEEKRQLNNKLILAAKQALVDEIDGLILMGADVDCVNENGSTPLMCAAHNGHINVVEKLFAHHANLNYTNYFAGNAIQYSAMNGHLAMVQWLIDNGADVNSANNKGSTALIYAAANGYADIVQALLFSNADVTFIGRSGRTALQWATKNDHLDAVKIITDFRLGYLVDPRINTKSARKLS